VATIKPSKPETQGKGILVRGRQLSTVNTSLSDLISFAYGLHARQVTGAPAWIETEKYDLLAQPDREGQPNELQWKTMLQKLLAELESLDQQVAAAKPEDKGKDNDNFRVKRYIAKYTINPALANGGWHDSIDFPAAADNPLNGNMYKPLYFDNGQAIHGANNVPTSPASHGCARLHVANQNQLIDWLGLVTFSTSLFCLVFALIRGNDEGWSSGPIVSLLVASAVLMTCFLIAESRQERPMLDLALFRERIGEAFQAAMFWVVIGLLLAVGYTYRHDLREIGDRVLAELLPGRAMSRGGTVEIARGNRGEFQIVAEINGARISTVYDTGASAVVLTQEAAKAAGLPLEFLNYSVQVETANGRTRAAPVTLDRIRVGAIEERQVPALIAQPGQLRTSLLGMSFLNRLESWEVRGDKLMMRGKP
jgi:aspartyl protease family protein